MDPNADTYRMNGMRMNEKIDGKGRGTEGRGREGKEEEEEEEEENRRGLE